jgi:predicted amidophosphoribosyltransferase
LLQRRFNQSALLAHHICKTPLFREHAITCLPDALYRLRRTASQDGLGAEARFANLDEALALTPRHSERLRGRAVILIDDVMTSGATLWSATHALRLGGARPIYVLVMARATKAA